MSTADEIKTITRGSGAVLVSLLRGSVVLSGRICRCLPRLVALGPRVWEMARRDAKATDERQQRAYEAAVARAQKAEKPEPTPDEVPRVSPSLRPPGEALGFLAAASVVGVGVLGTVVSVTVPRLLAVIPEAIGPYVAAAVAVGWTAAALAVAPPPGPQDDHENECEGEEREDDDQEDAEDQEQAPALDPGTALLLHVVGALAEAEAAGRTGVHLDVVIDSAEDAGLIPDDTDQSVFRDWLTAAGIPTVDKLGMRIGGKPTTRVGLRIDAATATLGMSPAALLRARSQAPATAPGETPVAVAAAPARVPAQAVGERPAEAPVPAPVSCPAPAALRLIPGGLLDPEQTPSPALSKGQV
ncbi:hypothetical protein J7I97_25040 [Streptomyces sp. ISL-87]|uniref:hypothetical protein n=1 Tax=Streptomyces sp. ISL-87 TaxID=2819188 RepID=UPI001BE90D2A|nr:hypothetical protein [Streptomyces sp. ISL-87]MBT2611434.1 hypothetical protein [Streptomyces sp. ISL-87]